MRPGSTRQPSTGAVWDMQTFQLASAISDVLTDKPRGARPLQGPKAVATLEHVADAQRESEMMANLMSRKAW